VFLPRDGVALLGTREALVGGVRRKGGDLAAAVVRGTEDCDEDLGSAGRDIGAALGVGLLARRAGTAVAAASVPVNSRVGAGGALAATATGVVPAGGAFATTAAGVVPPSGASCTERLMRRLTLEPVP